MEKTFYGHLVTSEERYNFSFQISWLTWPVETGNATPLPGYFFFQTYEAVITPDNNMIYQFNFKEFTR